MRCYSSLLAKKPWQNWAALKSTKFRAESLKKWNKKNSCDKGFPTRASYQAFARYFMCEVSELALSLPLPWGWSFGREGRWACNPPLPGAMAQGIWPTYWQITVHRQLAQELVKTWTNVGTSSSNRPEHPSLCKLEPCKAPKPHWRENPALKWKNANAFLEPSIRKTGIFFFPISNSYYAWISATKRWCYGTAEVAPVHIMQWHLEPIGEVSHLRCEYRRLFTFSQCSLTRLTALSVVLFWYTEEEGQKELVLIKSQDEKQLFFLQDRVGGKDVWRFCRSPLRDASKHWASNKLFIAGHAFRRLQKV